MNEMRLLALGLLVGWSATARAEDGAPPAPCERVWVRISNAPPQVWWCGRSVLADNLLVPSAAPLFAKDEGARGAFAEALDAAGRARVAAGLSLVAFSLSIVTLMGAVPQFLQQPGPAGVVLGITVFATTFAGGVIGLILHGLASDGALRHLARAVEALGGRSLAPDETVTRPESSTR